MDFESDDPDLDGTMRIAWLLEDHASGTRVTCTCRDIPPWIALEDNEAGTRSSLHETQSLLKEAGEQWRNGDAANYTVRPQPGEDGAGELAGKTELAIDWSRRAGELAVYLRKPFWGREYADDCFHALSELAFQHLDLEVVEAECAVENERSRRAIEKFSEAHGGGYVGVLRNWRIPDGGEPLDSHHFSITQEQYRAEK